MMVIKPMGRKGFISREGHEPLDTTMAELALKEARNAMSSGSYDVVILDEVNVALHLGLIGVQDLLDLMDSKPENVELVLTGRYAHPEIISRADVVQEMKNIKHHFDKGVKARKGIEYLRPLWHSSAVGFGPGPQSSDFSGSSRGSLAMIGKNFQFQSLNRFLPRRSWPNSHGSCELIKFMISDHALIDLPSILCSSEIRRILAHSRNHGSLSSTAKCQTSFFEPVIHF